MRGRCPQRGEETVRSSPATPALHPELPTGHSSRAAWLLRPGSGGQDRPGLVEVTLLCKGGGTRVVVS